jgi:hypothetical protein
MSYHFNVFIYVLILFISVSAPDDGSVLLPKHVVFYWFYVFLIKPV